MPRVTQSQLVTHTHAKSNTGEVFIFQTSSYSKLARSAPSTASRWGSWATAGLAEGGPRSVLHVESRWADGKDAHRSPSTRCGATPAESGCAGRGMKEGALLESATRSATRARPCAPGCTPAAASRCRPSSHPAICLRPSAEHAVLGQALLAPPHDLLRVLSAVSLLAVARADGDTVYADGAPRG